jgi:hypothetical protein
MFVDVFLGKQTIPFTSPIASDSPSDRCFSLISKTISLHLRGESAGIRNAILSGIKGIFTNSALINPKKDVVDSSILTMIKGEMFSSYTGIDPVIKSNTFVWYDSNEGGKLGSILWNLNGKKEKNNEQMIKLREISGKQYK